MSKQSLDFPLTLAGDGALADQVYEALHHAIAQGRFKRGQKLPSARTLADVLGVSRSTINHALDRLTANGFVNAQAGSGTYLNVQQVPEVLASASSVASSVAPKIGLSVWAQRLPAGFKMGLPMGLSVPIKLDFRPGLPDINSFPLEAWRRAVARQMRSVMPEILTYGEPQGLPSLRRLIAGHLARGRAMLCTSDDVIVTTGAQQALDLLARTLINPGDRVAMEEPGYPQAAAIFKAAGACVLPIAVDEEGLVSDDLPTDVKLVYVTPSHQFPSGVLMSLARRQALIRWAHAHDALIVEDDYDSEFRYGGQALESLQALDGGNRVVYVGTFSKSLLPGFRLGYMVPPRSIFEPLKRAKNITDRHSPSFLQAAMAEFMSDGTFAAFIRRMHSVYAERHAALTQGLKAFDQIGLRVIPSVAGLHIAVSLPSQAVEDRLLQLASRRGIGLYSVAPFYLHTPSSPGLIFGFGNCDAKAIAQGLSDLKMQLDSK